MLKGLESKIEEIEVLGNGTKLPHKIVGKISWSKVPGLVYIDVPETVLDPYITVLKLKRQTNLYRLYQRQRGTVIDTFQFFT
jgi:alpha-L-fucosidase